MNPITEVSWGNQVSLRHQTDPSTPFCAPGAQGNEALRMASSNGRTAIVKLLLADPRSDPTVDHSNALCQVCADL